MAVLREEEVLQPRVVTLANVLDFVFNMVLQLGNGLQLPAIDSLNVFSYIKLPELGASLFEIAQSLFALVRTLILGAMALSKNKRKER